MPHLHSHASHPSTPGGSAGIGNLVHWPRRYDLLVAFALAGRGRRVQRGIADALELRAGDEVLDVGCGTGTLTLALAERVGPAGSAVGVDASPEMIDAAREKSSGVGIGAEFDLVPAQDLPFPDGRFDAVVTSLTIHHLPPEDRVGALREIIRVVRPGGRVVIAEFQPPANRIARHLTEHLLGHAMASNDMADIRELATQAGWPDPHLRPTPVSWLGLIVARRPAQTSD